MGCIKQKSAFQNVQNVQIQIILRKHKVSSTFCSIQWFC